MAYTSGFTAVTGAIFTAAQYNTNVRDNFSAIWVYASAGDIAYATSPTTLARLGIGSSGKYLKSNGSASSWENLTAFIDDLRRQGGSATNWYVQGSTNYAPSSVKVQVGTVRAALAGGSVEKAVTFPVSFSYTPLIFLSLPKAVCPINYFSFNSVSKTGFSAHLESDCLSSDNVDFTWLAIGP